MPGKKDPTTTATRAKKKPAASLEVVVDGDYWVFIARDKDGKEVARGADGSRNRHYTEKVAKEQYPDLPVTVTR